MKGLHSSSSRKNQQWSTSNIVIACNNMTHLISMHRRIGIYRLLLLRSRIGSTIMKRKVQENNDWSKNIQKAMQNKKTYDTFKEVSVLRAYWEVLRWVVGRKKTILIYEISSCTFQIRDTIRVSKKRTLPHWNALSRKHRYYRCFNVFFHISKWIFQVRLKL